MMSRPALLSTKVFISLCLSVLFIPGRVSADSPDQAVDAYVKQQMTKHAIPGLSVAVVKDGKVVKLKGYGVASVEFDIPADGDTVFQLYSVSKIFAGVAAMKLVEDGRLSLDAPATDFVENLPPAWKAVRVRHLLTHTSGLPEGPANPRFASLPEAKRKGLTAAETIQLAAALPLKFAPGEKFSYHQSGYVLLGMIVEKLSGKSYADFLAERVFAPLAMTSTRFGDTETVVRRRPSTAYNRQSGELRNWVFPFSVKDYPAAGLNSSAADVSKFLVALEAGRVLKPESLRAMWARAKLNDGTESGYGLGWTIGEHKGRKVVGHEGGGSIWVAHFPDERLSVVVLCNLNGARADEIQYGVADFYLER
ncbi:MAG: serine hydrolase domain-containing protein [Pyrinomonadaceae bacterium]